MKWIHALVYLAVYGAGFATSILGAMLMFLAPPIFPKTTTGEILGTIVVLSIFGFSVGMWYLQKHLRQRWKLGE